VAKLDPDDWEQAAPRVCGASSEEENLDEIGSIVAAALALSATVMPAEPLPVARPSGPPQGAQEAMSNGTCAWSSTAQVRRLLRHRSARHNAHRSQPQPR